MKITKTFLVLCVVAFVTGVTWGTASANPVDNVTTWLSNEKTKTIEYQTKSWAKAKSDWSSLMKKLGINGKSDESQD
jgi:hypothetical protein